MFYMVFKCFLDIFTSGSDACFKCFNCLQTYIASVASRCFKSRSGVASRSLLAFDCLALVPPLLSTLASEPEARAGAVPFPSSRCWWRGVGWWHGRGRAATSGAGRCSFCPVVPLRWWTGAPSVTLFRGSLIEIRWLRWQVLDES